MLKNKPHLQKCLTCCRHCRILFLTHPRNTNRNDLRCPFGCRQVHRNKSAIRRSTEYYRSKEGKEKKKHLNARRNRRASFAESSHDENSDSTFGDTVDQTTLFHIQMTTSLIEERLVGLNETICMVDKILRQLSIDIRKKFDYAASYPQKNPP